jgi:hypothetical protein
MFSVLEEKSNQKIFEMHSNKYVQKKDVRCKPCEMVNTGIHPLAFEFGTKFLPARTISGHEFVLAKLLVKFFTQFFPKL